jgi:hypothetical protein
LAACRCAQELGAPPTILWALARAWAIRAMRLRIDFSFPILSRDGSLKIVFNQATLPKKKR